MKNSGWNQCGIRSTLLAGVALVACPSLGQAQTATRATGVEEIVVTAQKREQSLQEVPVSMSALSQETIVANRIQDISDLSGITPNLSIRPGAGGSKIPQYSMRGIYTFGSAIGTDKGVSFYIDGVYIQAVAGSIFEFADIERVEVLRGPQGTLFGRNSTGGAVSVITRKPLGEFDVGQEFTLGNNDQFRSKTRVDLPKFGPVSLSASYLHSERDGDTRNLGAGTVWDHGPATGGRMGTEKSPERLGDTDVEGFFLAADIDLHPDVALSYKFDYSQNDFTSEAAGANYLLTPAALKYGGINPAVLAVYSLYNASPNPKTPIDDERPDAVNNWFTTPGHSEAWGHNFTASWQLNDTISFKNILALRSSEVDSSYQLDGLGGVVAGGAPFGFVLNNSQSDDEQWSNELQMNVSTDRFDITAGLIHFHSEQDTGGYDNQFNTLQFSTILGQNTAVFPTPFVIPRNTGYEKHSVQVDSDAAYVQPEMHLTDRLDVFVGARVTRDDKNGKETVPGSIAAPSLGRSVPIEYEDTRDTWTAGVNYRLTDDILTYAKYATGYISGGQLATIEFDVETAESFETGIKADLFDQRLRSNLAVFQVDYESIQQATLGTLTGVPSAAPFSQAIVPSADADAMGVEWENTLVAMDGLTLTANVGYLDFEFDQDSVFPGFANASGIPGFQEFHRPEWTGSFAAQYETGEVFAGGYLTFRADANFKDETLMTSDIAPGTGPAAQVDPAYRDAGTAPVQWIVNSRVALNEIDVGHGAKVEVAVWGRNIFDNGDITQFTGLGFAGAVIYERARSYGIDVNIDF